MCDDPNCRCEAAMAASYRAQKTRRAGERSAMAAAIRVYRSHHPFSSAYRALAAASEVQGTERGRVEPAGRDRPDGAGQIRAAAPQ